MSRLAVLVLVTLVCGSAAPSMLTRPRSTVPGPIEVDVLRVHDGDTFKADIHHLPMQVTRASIRPRGVDAPELNSRCLAERKAARRARDAVRGWMADAGRVEILNLGFDKYANRYDADVRIDGKDLAGRLIAEGLARPYDGGRRAPWCDGTGRFIPPPRLTDRLLGSIPNHRRGRDPGSGAPDGRKGRDGDAGASSSRP